MKLNKKHFDLFKRECLKCQKELGLTDWHIYYQMKKLDDVIANVSWDLEARKATISLNNDQVGSVGYGESITTILKTTALHEVLHILFANFYDMARAREFSRFTFDAEEHAVINRIINWRKT